VKGYGELGELKSFSEPEVFLPSLSLSEYWLSSLKILTVVLFIIIGVLVNAGLNSERRFIGVSNWTIPGAPFVGGFGGFARVFVTASFACQ
jgi:amino acid permease